MHLFASPYARMSVAYFLELIIGGYMIWSFSLIPFAWLRRFLQLLIIALLPAVLLTGCNSRSENAVPVKTNSASVVDDLYGISYAERFSLIRHDGFSVLQVAFSQGARSDTLRYILLPSGKPAPDGYGDYAVIHTPVKRVVAFSTTNIGFINMLGESACIVGVSRPDFVNTLAVKKRIDEGKISEVGMPFGPDLETILQLDPDLVLLPALPPSLKSGYQSLVQSGIPVLVVAEWLEASPLGRLEWLKLFGALLDRENFAQKRFTDIESSYRKVAFLTENFTETERPTVLTGLPMKDAWFLPAGGSYVAALLQDAGASYPWIDTPGTGSLRFGFEGVCPVALKADYWLNPGVVETMEELLAVDVRFRDFASIKAGRVFNNNRMKNSAGGNAYWEYGVARPDLILRDLVMILHPGLLESNGIGLEMFTFYREVQ